MPNLNTYLVTIGDAIASFLETEDLHTSGIPASKSDFLNDWPMNSDQSTTKLKVNYWFRAASVRRWIITILICVATLAVVGGLLSMTLRTQQALNVSTDIKSLWDYGMGQPQQWAVALTGVSRNLSQSHGFFFAVLVANSPQVIVSGLYLLYNNLLTVMVVADEWNDFIFERKTLRLSIPQGIQRSAYFLSLPYQYSLVLMVFSGLLHWLISQSVFVIQTVAYAAPDFRRVRCWLFKH